MDRYSVLVERRGHTSVEFTEKAIAAFTELVGIVGGVASFGQDRPTYGARIFTDNHNAASAATDATQFILDAAAGAGLPDWPVVKVEATREDVFGEELAAGPSLLDVRGTRDEITYALDQAAEAAHHLGNIRLRDEATAALASINRGATLARAGHSVYTVTP